MADRLMHRAASLFVAMHRVLLRPVYWLPEYWDRWRIMRGWEGWRNESEWTAWDEYRRDNDGMTWAEWCVGTVRAQIVRPWARAIRG